MITLVTGTPGAGKTLWVVREIMRSLGKSGRPIFHNITDFDPSRRIPEWGHIVDKGDGVPLDWFELLPHTQGPEYFGPTLPVYPCGSIFVFDEVQRQWPASYTTRIPEFIARLDTHRHRNFDFYIVTQHPKLIAPAVRRFVGKHHDLFRPYGAKYSKRQSWEVCCDDPPRPTGADVADVERIRFDAKLFDLYNSATAHTVKFSLPGRLVGIVALFVSLLLVAGWIFYGAVSGFRERHQAQREAAGVDVAAAVASGARVWSSCAPVVALQPLTARVSGALVRLPSSTTVIRTSSGLYACADPVQIGVTTVKGDSNGQTYSQVSDPTSVGLERDPA